MYNRQNVFYVLRLYGFNFHMKEIDVLPSKLSAVKVSAHPVPAEDDGVEAALRTQMAGAHDAALACLARAAEAGQEDDVRALKLRLGTRLLALYSWQVRTLDVWQRGRAPSAGDEKIVVGWLDGAAADPDPSETDPRQSE